MNANIAGVQERRNAGIASHLIAVLVLLFQPIIFFKDVLVRETSQIPFDFAGYHLPLIAYMAKCIRRGAFPFWDPFTYCGFPFHADLTTQLFYPLNWAVVLLGNASAGHQLLYWLNWQVPLHMFLAGVFTFALLRHLESSPGAALFGATVFQLSGFFTSQAQHLGAICGAAWLPLVWLALFRLSKEFSVRWLSILSLALGMTILSGFPAVTAVVFVSAALLAVSLVLGRHAPARLLLWLAGGVLLAACLTVVQIIPTYQLSRLSVASQRANWLTTGGGMPLESVVSLVIPNYHHVFTPFDPSQYKLPYNFTFLYLYSGIPVLLLLLAAPFLKAARYLRTFWILTAVSAFWMMGESTPVYKFLYQHLPMNLKAPLYAEFALLAFCLSLSVCGSLALNRLLRDRVPGLAWGIALVAAADLIGVSSGRPMNSLEIPWKKVTSEFHFRGSKEALQLVWNLTWQNKPPWRVDYLEPGSEWITGASMLEVPTANGDNPFALLRLLRVRALFCTAYPWTRLYPVRRLDSPILDLLNIRYVFGSALLPEETIGPLGFRRIGNIVEMNIYENREALPRFFLVNKVRNVKNEDDALAILASKDFRPREEAVVENLGPGWSFSSQDNPGLVEVKEYSPNRIELLVETSYPAFLVTSESMYPGWRAELDGKAVEIVQTNVAFRGLPVPAGGHRIAMRYWPLHFLLYAAVSALTFLVLLGGLFSPNIPAIRGLKT